MYAHYNRDKKLIIFTCDACGSWDLSHPRESASDHRDVIRFTCNSCKNSPYWATDIFDVIPITTENREQIKNEICKQCGWNPDEYSWRIDPCKTSGDL